MRIEKQGPWWAKRKIAFPESIEELKTSDYSGLVYLENQVVKYLHPPMNERDGYTFAVGSTEDSLILCSLSKQTHTGDVFISGKVRNYSEEAWKRLENVQVGDSVNILAQKWNPRNICILEDLCMSS